MSGFSLGHIQFSLELLNAKKKAYERLYKGAILANILLISISYYWLLVINILLLLLLWTSMRRLLVEVGKEGIRYPSFPHKFFKWDSLSQVILKDGLLTIDKKDNTLIQQPLKDASLVNEEEFNTFCQLQLQQVK